jgi:hypothetical protein
MPLLRRRSDPRVKLRRNFQSCVISCFNFAPNCVHAIVDPAAPHFVALLLCKIFVIARTKDFQAIPLSALFVASLCQTIERAQWLYADIHLAFSSASFVRVKVIENSFVLRFLTRMDIKVRRAALLANSVVKAGTMDPRTCSKPTVRSGFNVCVLCFLRPGHADQSLPKAKSLLVSMGRGAFKRFTSGTRKSRSIIFSFLSFFSFFKTGSL